MDAEDARYELPCRVLLAVAAGIHWLAAALAWAGQAPEVNSDLYARLLYLLVNPVGLPRL